MTNRPTARATLALAGALTILPSAAAMAEPLAPTGGAGNTGVSAPPGTGGVGSGARDLGPSLAPSPAPAGNAASPSNELVPGTTPGVNIGGTDTAGPPGTGGAAGGPGLSGQ